MKTGMSVNECGTDVSVHRCDVCGDRYTVCPPESNPDSKLFKNCLSTECGSYDPACDVDRFFGSNVYPIGGIARVSVPE